MGSIKLLLQGFIIGIGKIIPGVSGAMFAMMFGVYEKALNIISNLKTELIKNIKFISVLGIGVISAIIFGSNIIKKCLDSYYIQTMFLFIGMMTSGIKPLFQNLQEQKINKKNIVIAVVVTLILMLISFVEFGQAEGTLTKTPLTIVLLIISGFLDAVGTIIPGVCGTALLMILGYYDTVISALGDVLNFSNLGNNLFVLIPFLIGMGLGVLLVSKLVNYLFKNYKISTYCSIIAFAIISIIILLVKAFEQPFSNIDLIVSVILFILGYIVSTYLDKLGD